MESINFSPRSRQRRRGTSLVEFALIAPLLIMIMLGILEFAIIARNQLMLANAAREGARTLALGRSTTSARTRVKSVSTQVPLSDNHITFTCSTDNGATFPFSVGDNGSQNNAPAGSMVKVTVERTHTTLTGFFPFLRNYKLRVDATMRREA